MKGDLVPDQDHISRYCPATKCTEEGKVLATAFMLKKADEEYLSVNWLEFLRLPSQDEEINEIRRVLGTKLDLGGRARIALLNVGELIEQVFGKSNDERRLSVKHEPLNNDPSHSGVYGMVFKDDPLIPKLIAETVQETYPART